MNKRKVSLSTMRRTAAIRKRCIEIAHATIAKAHRMGWPEPKLRIVGSNVDFLGLCDARSIVLSGSALDSPLTARFVAAHELGHFRRHHGKLCFVVNALPTFAFAVCPMFGFGSTTVALALLAYVLLRVFKTVWNYRTMYRYEREADEDARTLVGAASALFIRRNGTSEGRLREATRNVFDEISETIERAKRDIAGAAIRIHESSK